MALLHVGIVRAGTTVPLALDNFTRAETDHYLALNARDAGGVGKFRHNREPASIDNQTVIRMNRDTLYSFAVLDLAAGPATVSLPDAGTPAGTTPFACIVRDRRF
jgi:hypothetical protein